MRATTPPVRGFFNYHNMIPFSGQVTQWLSGQRALLTVPLTTNHCATQPWM